MYPKYFGLKEASFSITPDPHYLFLSEQHREALAHLLYGVGDGGGFVLLTGEVGTGKTTVCRAFLEQLPSDVDVALVLNPAMTATELLHAICDEFGLDVPDAEQSVKALVDRLNAFLLDVHARGRRPVLIIDEAQNLRPKVMEQIRLLTNLETTKHKLLQIFLIGQPELRQMLASPDLRQLNQRVTARFHLRPLGARETAAYVDHRIAVAGVERPLFTASALREVHRRSGGVPRLINLLCDRALLGAAVSRQMQVTPGIVRRAAAEVRGTDDPALPSRRPTWAFAASVLVAAGLGVWIGAAGVLESLPARVSGLIGGQGGVARLSEVSEGGPSEPEQTVAQSGADGASADRGAAATSQTQPVETHLARGGGDGDGDTADLDASAPSIVQGRRPAADEMASAASASAGAGGEAPISEPPGAQSDAARALVVAGDPSSAAIEPAGEGVTDSSGGSQAGPDDTAAAGALSALAVAADAGEDAGPVADRPDFPRISMSAVAADLPEVSAEELSKASIPRTDVVDELLRLWGISADAAVSRLDCPAVAAFGLDCEGSNGRWSDLRLFDRPVALELTMADGSERFAVIGGIDSEYAMLHRGDQVKRVPIATLDERWSGDYLLLWRLPPVGVRVIGNRSSAEAVAWLRKRFAALPDVELAEEPARYDATLVDVVRRFQSSNGLVADGVAGPRTLILLSNVLAADGTLRLSQSR